MNDLWKLLKLSWMAKLIIQLKKKKKPKHKLKSQLTLLQNDKKCKKWSFTLSRKPVEKSILCFAIFDNTTKKGKNSLIFVQNFLKEKNKDKNKLRFKFSN